MPSPDDWQVARRAYELGASGVNDIARALGVTHQRVSTKKREEGWREPVNGKGSAVVGVRVPSPGSLPAPTQTEVAVEQTRAAAASPLGETDWAARRQTEAAAAGLVASALRNRLMQEIRRDGGWVERDGERHYFPAMSDKNVRALATAYREFVTMAQLMIGDPTGREEYVLTDEERQTRLTVLMRRIRERAIETTATDGDG